jgi:hypothetical protein
VDAVRVADDNVQKLLMGSDVVGSAVRISAKKKDGTQVDITLRRQSVAFMNAFQMYSELLEQLNAVAKRDKDTQNLVRRISLKVQEIVKFQAGQLDDTLSLLEVYESSTEELIRMIRISLQEHQKGESNPEANPVKGSIHSSADRHFLAESNSSVSQDGAISRSNAGRNENLESEIKRLSSLISKSNMASMGSSDESQDVVALKQQIRDINKELTAQSMVLQESLQRENRANLQVREMWQHSM